jgi:hypothetical protein
MWREKREARNGKGEGKGGEVKKIWKFQLGSAATFAALHAATYRQIATPHMQPGTPGRVVSLSVAPPSARQVCQAQPAYHAAFLAGGKMKALQGITLTPQFLNMYSSV